MGAFFYLEKDMPTNQLLPFGMGESPNRISYDDWNALPARLTGFQSGIASSQQFNYILAQGGVAGYIVGQLIVDQLSQDATLTDAAALYTSFKSALAKFVPSGIADKSILTAKLADLSVTTAKLAALGVTAEKIAASAIITDKIKDLAVTTAKLAAGCVTNEKIAQRTIAFDRLATKAIATTEQAQQGTLDNVLMTPLKVAQAIAVQIPPAVPTGMIAFFDLTDIPDGWLLCDGSAVSRTTYANLFAKIGTRHGAGDGSTTFNLPDMDARFLEGTTDTGQVGTSVEPGLPNITGSIRAQSDTILESGCFVRGTAVSSAWTLIHSDYYSTDLIRFSAKNVNPIFSSTTTVQPASLRSLACIKV